MSESGPTYLFFGAVLLFGVGLSSYLAVLPSSLLCWRYIFNVDYEIPGNLEYRLAMRNCYICNYMDMDMTYANLLLACVRPRAVQAVIILYAQPST